jgi:hypothetical protein
MATALECSFNLNKPISAKFNLEVSVESGNQDLGFRAPTWNSLTLSQSLRVVCVPWKL